VTLAAATEVVRLQEWQTIVRPDLWLSDRDRELAKGLNAGRRVVIEELRSGLRISTRSWVGLVRFETFDLSVAPKLAGENIGLVQLLAYTTGLPGLRRIPATRTLPVDGEDLNLFDLLALLFATECAAVLKGGLISDYLSREDTLSTLRGRLLTDRQLTRQFGRLDRLECRYDVYETDTPENQVLSAALTVCARRATDPDVRRRVKRSLTIFSEVCDPAGANLRLIRETLVYTRMNEHYREAHSLAWFIFDGLGIRDLLSPGAARSFAFLIDMNALFEKFVCRALDAICSRRGLRVRYQNKDRSILWAPARDRPYAAVIPDLLIEGAGGDALLPVDAKYKRYDAKRLDNADIYQTLIYALAYGAVGAAGESRALVVYPSSNVSSSEAVVEIRHSQGSVLATVCALGVHIPTLLSEVRTETKGPQSSLLAEHLPRYTSDLARIGERRSDSYAETTQPVGSIA